MAKPHLYFSASPAVPAMKHPTAITLLFPHQLYLHQPALQKGVPVVLVEEWLYFSQYRFHKLKLVLHRASMQYYRGLLLQQGYEVQYIEATSPLHDIRQLVPHLAGQQVSAIHYTDVTDDWLKRRLHKACRLQGIQLTEHPTPGFLNRPDEVNPWFDEQRQYFQTDFYIHQRKMRGLLLTPQGHPEGGKWSFDHENRLKFPPGTPVPHYPFPRHNAFVTAARDWVETHFAGNPGAAFLLKQHDPRFYPVTHAEAEEWLNDFLAHRFAQFGIYEDAIVQQEHFLHHSVLSPLLNTGLLTPAQVVNAALKAAARYQVALNSLEGFIRQITGWREFIRIVYEREGRKQRTGNYWQFTRAIPARFWEGNTGIPPIDHTIYKLLQTGYTHHIERLMLLGNFMLLCEFDPNEVYRWFMALYIDAYDWVMVPNIYGMTQFADGGLMMTKPYISSSNYIRKMSDYPKGEWQETWDGLFWRFMHVHRDFFATQPRLGMLLTTLDKMDAAKRGAHLQRAERYLASLST